MLALTSSPCADDEFVCNTAMDWTDNEQVAEVADVVIGTPLAIAGILLGGLIARFVLHRLVDRLVRKAEVGVLPDRVSRMAMGAAKRPRGARRAATPSSPRAACSGPRPWAACSRASSPASSSRSS